MSGVPVARQQEAGIAAERRPQELLVEDSDDPVLEGDGPLADERREKAVDPLAPDADQPGERALRQRQLDAPAVRRCELPPWMSVPRCCA